MIQADLAIKNSYLEEEVLFLRSNIIRDEIRTEQL